MIKSNLKKIAAIGMCCSLVASGSVWAMLSDTPRDDRLRNVLIDTDNPILKNQMEIDQFLFVTNVEDIENAGFTVTHTSPQENYVEIGILPYNEVNSEYLYNIFGKDKIKVVEGVQAVLLPISAEYTRPQTDGIAIKVNSKWLQLDVEPFIENGRTLVPLRGVMEELGAEVTWNGTERSVEVNKEDISIKLLIGNDNALVTRKTKGEISEENIKLDVPAKIVNDRTFIPGRFVSETIGANVDWDHNLRAMIVETDTTNEDGIENTDEEISIDYEVVDTNDIEENENLSKWYQENSDKKGIYYINDGEWKYVLVAAGEKPTGGYHVKVDKVYKTTPETAYVNAKIISPDKDSMVTMALTYPRVLIRFYKSDTEKVEGKFIDSKTIVNDQQDDIGKSLKTMGKAISVDEVKEMKLYTLMQEEIKTFTDYEIEKIIDVLNINPTYTGAYITLLAGNNIQITLKDGGNISITSYGNKEHVILSGEINGQYIGYCIVAPSVGSILLEN
ncbi:UNVERIFIED_CONTAM: protease stability complex PrcB-like protein [Acetivibrio alkalicellulosi]